MGTLKVKTVLTEQKPMRLKCPACGRMENFAYISHGADLALLAFRVKKLHTHMTLVCGGCAAVFRLNEAASERIAKGGTHRITREDLER